ncbi:MAG: hypothetical protein AB8B91_11505 [Rubripirellula sp.]
MTQHRTLPIPAHDAYSGRFSIRQLMMLTAMIGAWLAMYQLLPHVAILVSGIWLACAATHWWVSTRTRNPHVLLRLIVILIVVSSWAYLYVVSIGPAGVIAREHEERRDMIGIYAPVGWLHANTPLREPLQRYSELWNS